MVKRPVDIYLIRHGDAGYFQEDTAPLSLRGELEVELLARKLKHITFSAAYVSPFKRALQTCHRALKHQPRLEPVIEHSLEELQWTYWPKISHRYFGREMEIIRAKPGYQKHARLLARGEKRALQLLNRIYHENPKGTVAIFTHGNVIRSFITGIMGAHLLGFYSLEIATTSLSLIRISQVEGTRIIFVNNCSHLDGFEERFKKLNAKR